LLSVTGLSAQEKIVVPLRLNLEVQQFSGMIISERTNDGPLAYTSPAGEGMGHAPGRVLFKLQPVESLPNTYHVFIDANNDGDLRNETPQTLTPKSSSVVSVTRKWANGKQLALPYSLKYSRDADSQGRMRERFLWMPHYRAEGRLKTAKCDGLFVVLDLSTDGQFNDRDLGGGSTIGVDRDGDGRIWGKDEYLMGNQIIEFCGERFLVAALAVDGTSITLTRTTLRVPKLGEQLPEFSLTTLDGQRIESRGLRNKIYLLDFWASWCKPCVEKFGLVKQVASEFKTDVSVIAVNVDEQSRSANAHEIIKQYGLTWPHVMSGQGEADPLWKMFGGMEGNRLAIPLYVIVDTEGRLRYAANGGEDLSELRRIIKSLANMTGAQPQPTAATRIKSPAVVRGFIGGESHDAYVIRAAKGKILTVQLSWRSEDGNRAQFNVLDEADYFSGEPLTFGKFSQDEKRWAGRIPKTGDYYIYVVAHPSARYRLKVTLN
jgi:thiol-disulfide isomerase/thioredoxin